MKRFSLFFQQFYNSNSTTERDLFTKKNSGGIETDDVFEYGRADGVGVYIQDKADPITFRVTFSPMDPYNKDQFRHSDWMFECFDPNVVLDKKYPQQMCGQCHRLSGVFTLVGCGTAK